jgi:hypothetical protein
MSLVEVLSSGRTMRRFATEAEIIAALDAKSMSGIRITLAAAGRKKSQNAALWRWKCLPAHEWRYRVQVVGPGRERDDSCGSAEIL